MGALSVTMRTPGLIGVMLTAWLAGLTMAGIMPLLPLISADFGAGPAEASLVRFLITVVGVAMIIGSFLAGFLAERFGTRPVLVTCLVLVAVFGVASGFAPNLYAMIGLRFFYGLAGASAGVLALSTIISAFEGSARNRWTGIFIASSTIGTMVIVPLSGWLGDPDWHKAFYLNLFTLPVAALAWWGISPAAAAPQAPQTGDKAPAATGKLPGRLIALGLLTGVCVSGGSLFVPFHLAGEAKASASAISMVMVGMMIASTLFSMSFGNLRNHFALRTLQVVGFLLIGAGHVTSALSVDYWPILAGQFLVGLGIGLLTPSLFLFANVIAPQPLQARYTGIARSAYYGGPLLTQLLLEPVAAQAGANAGMLGVALIAIVGGVFLAILPGRFLADLRPPQPAPQAQ